MKKYKITAVMADATDEWIESFNLRRDKLTIDDAREYICDLVSIYNSSLRPNETPRKLVRIITVEYSC